MPVETNRRERTDILDRVIEDFFATLRKHTIQPIRIQLEMDNPAFEQDYYPITVASAREFDEFYVKVIDHTGTTAFIRFFNCNSPSDCWVDTFVVPGTWLAGKIEEAEMDFSQRWEGGSS